MRTNLVVSGVDVCNDMTDSQATQIRTLWVSTPSTTPALDTAPPMSVVSSLRRFNKEGRVGSRFHQPKPASFSLANAHPSRHPWLPRLLLNVPLFSLKNHLNRSCPSHLVMLRRAFALTWSSSDSTGYLCSCLTALEGTDGPPDNGICLGVYAIWFVSYPSVAHPGPLIRFTAWGLTMAAYTVKLPLQQYWTELAKFLIMAINVRGSACTINDILDRDFDAGVGMYMQRIYSQTSYQCGYLQREPRAVPYPADACQYLPRWSTYLLSISSESFYPCPTTELRMSFSFIRLEAY